MKQTKSYLCNSCLKTFYHNYLLVTGRRFSPGTPVSFTNKSDRHDIAEILLKVALNTITLTHNYLRSKLLIFSISL
jgi:hypothetical protein